MDLFSTTSTPSSSTPTPKRDVTEGLMAVPGVESKLLGAITLWHTSGDLALGRLAPVWAKYNLDPTLMPEPPSRKVALTRAVDSCKTTHRFPRRVKRGGRTGWALVDERVVEDTEDDVEISSASVSCPFPMACSFGARLSPGLGKRADDLLRHAQGLGREAIPNVNHEVQRTSGSTFPDWMVRRNLVSALKGALDWYARQVIPGTPAAKSFDVDAMRAALDAVDVSRPETADTSDPLDFKVVAQVFLGPDDKPEVETEEADLADTIHKAFLHEIDRVSAADVSAHLSKLVRNELDGVPLRVTGGVYLVPAPHVDTLHRIKDAFAEASAHRVFSIPAAHDDKAVEAVVFAARAEAQREIDIITAALAEHAAAVQGGDGKALGARALTTKVAQAKAMIAKVARYEDLLDEGLDDLTQKLTTLQAAAMQAKFMVGTDSAGS